MGLAGWTPEPAGGKRLLWSLPKVAKVSASGQCLPAIGSEGSLQGCPRKARARPHIEPFKSSEGLQIPPTPGGDLDVRVAIHLLIMQQSLLSAGSISSM